MRKYQEHKAILESILEVKAELKLAAERHASVSLDVEPILTRLSTLYSCLDIQELKRIVSDMEGLDQRRNTRLPRYIEKKSA